MTTKTCFITGASRGSGREQAAEMRGARTTSPSDPAASSIAILEIVDAEQPPLRIVLGDGPLAIAERHCAGRLVTWRDWADISVAAHGS